LVSIDYLISHLFVYLAQHDDKRQLKKTLSVYWPPKNP